MTPAVLLNPTVFRDLVAAAVLVAVLAAFGYTYHRGQAQAERAAAIDRAEKAEEWRKVTQAAGDRLAAVQAKQQATTITVTREVLREVHSDPIYASCVVPDGGLRSLNESRGYEQAASEPTPAVPAGTHAEAPGDPR